MATFVRCSNNSLIAVMRQEDLERIQDGQEPHYGVFLFLPDQYLSDGFAANDREPWIAGNYSLMERLLAGHATINTEFYVSFSNGHQLYGDRDELLKQFRRIGNLAEAMDAFELITGHELATAEPPMLSATAG